MDGGAWWAAVHGVAEGRTRLSDFTFTFMHWRRKGNPLQCSCLENPRDGGAWWAAIHGVAQSWTRLKWLSSSSLLGAGIFAEFYSPTSSSSSGSRPHWVCSGKTNIEHDPGDPQCPPVFPLLCWLGLGQSALVLAVLTADDSSLSSWPKQCRAIAACSLAILLADCSGQADKCSWLVTLFQLWSFPLCSPLLQSDLVYRALWSSQPALSSISVPQQGVEAPSGSLLCHTIAEGDSDLERSKSFS